MSRTPGSEPPVGASGVREPLLEVRPLHRLEDARGHFVKILQARHLDGRPFGEVYLSAGTPGEVRGSHYHRRTTEWFCPVQGRGVLYAWEVEGARRETVALDAASPVSVRVPPLVAHALVADPTCSLAVLAVADVEYDPADTDTYAVPLEIIRGEAP